MESESTTSALEALKMLQQAPNKFGIVLSDFDVPEMIGGQLCIEMRKDHRLRHLPFICTSDSGMPIDVTARYKIDDTLMKPFSIDQVEESIHRHIYCSAKYSAAQESSFTHDSKEADDRDKFDKTNQSDVCLTSPPVSSEPV